jgi:hypothetical protein
LGAKTGTDSGTAAVKALQRRKKLRSWSCHFLIDRKYVTIRPTEGKPSTVRKRALVSTKHLARAA